MGLVRRLVKIVIQAIQIYTIPQSNCCSVCIMQKCFTDLQSKIGLQYSVGILSSKDAGSGLLKIKEIRMM